MGRALGTKTSAEVEPVPLLILPLGATEQHGPHLPLDTDTRIATAWAEAVAREVDGAVVAPSLPYGSSGEHQSFPGTISIGREALHHLLVEFVRSAAGIAERILVLSGHAGNVAPLGQACAQLRDEGHDVIGTVPQLTGADAHAGRTETSLLLAIAPDLVHLDRAEAGNTAPIGSLIDRLRTGGVWAVSENGVLGDPSGATAEEGRQLLAALVSSALEQLGEVHSSPSAEPGPC